MSLKEAIDHLKKEMTTSGVIPRNGLGEELFLFSSTLSPVVNVDLVVYNDKNQVLLSWRNDPYAGTGWHIPGGCIRFGERIDERIQRTAISELGSEVEYLPETAAVYEVFNEGYRAGLTDQNERFHFITLVYLCRPKTEILTNESVKWFDDLPEDLLASQNCYRADWETMKNKVIRWK